jgi:hypothetical protein
LYQHIVYEENYRNEYKGKGHHNGIDGGCFGDITLVKCRTWKYMLISRRGEKCNEDVEHI